MAPPINTTTSLNNFTVDYDINRPSPTHRNMDQHMAKIPGQVMRQLESSWHVHTSWSLEQVYHHVNSILTTNDRLRVVEATNMMFRNLLVPNETVKKAWNAPSRASAIVDALSLRFTPSTQLRTPSAPTLPAGFGLGIRSRRF